MSSDAQPIDPVAFAQALESLPIDALHTKAAELRNSIAHLKISNEQMIPFAEGGDQDCKDAMFENLVVIGRINERIALLRNEVEKRGMRWADGEVEDAERRNETHISNGVPVMNGHTAAEGESSTASGTLTDDELRARMMGRMQDDDDDEGVHL